MSCKDCPFGKEDFERRMDWYTKTIEEEGIPNEIYGHETYEDAAEDAEQFLWCDKVGGKVFCFGYCADAHPDISKDKNHSQKKRKNKRERYLQKQSRLKKLDTPKKMDRYLSVVSFHDTPKSHYKRIYRGQSSSYFKNQANRAVRRYKKGLQSGRNFCKVYDFWRKYC